MTTTFGSGSSSESQCICEQGFFGLPPDKVCSECQVSDGVWCPLNSTIPWVKLGYYRADTNLALLCEPSDACQTTGIDVMTPCDPAYTGFLCGTCSREHYRSGTGCKECPGATVKWITIMVGLAVLVFILGRVTAKRTSIPVDFRITLQAIQVIALFPNITSQWPQSVQVILQVFSVTNFNIELFYPECVVPMTFWTKFYGKMLFPIMIFVLFSLLFGTHEILTKIFPGYFRSGSILLSHRLLMLFQFIVVTMYTFLVSTVFQPFNCFSQSDGSYTMFRFPSAKCYDQDWKKNIPALVTFILLYCFGIPLALIYVFMKNKSNLDSKEFRMKFGNLTSPFSSNFFYWELVVMLKKGLFMVSNDFLSSHASYVARYCTGIGILFFFLWLDVTIKPYKQEEINLIQCSWSLITVLVLLCQGLIFQSQDSTSAFAVYFFGVVIIIVLVGATTVSVCMVIKRSISQSGTLLIPNAALPFLSQEVVKDVVNCHSEESLARQGLLEVCQDLRKYLSPSQRNDLENILQDHTSVAGTRSFVGDSFKQ
eukprot:TRINITY_DN3592_c0_g2_i1.p1 TRINITY_DN3592_c0_g2~~TRINITY_DN3592_c0_g2_i1.p1  ORF type:complete len:603 (-),score=103.62 TRINITY_DN3592_c0_g2_i1:99-1715(-)